jgi:hypothetical protein
MGGGREDGGLMQAKTSQRRALSPAVGAGIMLFSVKYIIRTR